MDLRPLHCASVKNTFVFHLIKYWTNMWNLTFSRRSIGHSFFFTSSEFLDFSSLSQPWDSVSTLVWTDSSSGFKTCQLSCASAMQHKWWRRWCDWTSQKHLPLSPTVNIHDTKYHMLMYTCIASLLSYSKNSTCKFKPLYITAEGPQHSTGFCTFW